ncbi:MAG: hypothetical protein HY513_02415 [Candidatus Aenigmarchaeota archaeon]|nr:hypothetical protein [Candidatus Aenigmarchaeota archaeon]
MRRIIQVKIKNGQLLSGSVEVEVVKYFSPQLAKGVRGSEFDLQGYVRWCRKYDQGSIPRGANACLVGVGRTETNESIGTHGSIDYDAIPIQFYKIRM